MIIDQISCGIIIVTLNFVTVIRYVPTDKCVKKCNLEFCQVHCKVERGTIYFLTYQLNGN